MINRKGSTLRMLNANTEIQIPVLVSNKGYGLFWDNYSTTNFAGNVSSNTRYSFSVRGRRSWSTTTSSTAPPSIR